MPARYYDFNVRNWRFIIIDGNDLSYHAWSKTSARYKESVAYHKQLHADKPTWNGAIGPVQMRWIEEKLQAAEKSGESVVFYGHFPIYPENKHNLWNSKEIMALLEQYPSVVVAWINGHNHAGNYGKKAGIHYLTLHAMVTKEISSYSILRVFEDRIEVDGFGRQPDRVLSFQ
jgi:hypothetical protein